MKLHKLKILSMYIPQLVLPIQIHNMKNEKKDLNIKFVSNPSARI